MKLRFREFNSCRNLGFDFQQILQIIPFDCYLFVFVYRVGPLHGDLEYSLVGDENCLMVFVCMAAETSPINLLLAAILIWDHHSSSSEREIVGSNHSMANTSDK